MIELKIKIIVQVIRPKTWNHRLAKLSFIESLSNPVVTDKQQMKIQQIKLYSWRHNFDIKQG